MKKNIFRKGIAAILLLTMLGSVAFGASISKTKFRKDVVTVDYYVGGDDATIWVYDAADPSNVIYVDQEEADGSFSFGLPEDFEGEAVKVRVGGYYEDVAEELVYVTPTPAPTPDPESTEAGGIYSYVNKEDFTTTVINYDEQYVVTDADYKIEPNAAAFGKGENGMIIYEEYAGSEGVFYIEGHALSSEKVSYYFDPIKKGKAKISIKFMIDTFPQAENNDEVEFFTIMDTTNDMIGIKNCAAAWATTNGAPVGGMYVYNGASDYTRYRTTGKDATWQTLTYIVDMDAKTFQVDYNGTLVNEGAAFAFNQDVTELSKIYFHGTRGQWNGNYYVDEIKVMAEEADEYATHTVTFYNDDKASVITTKAIKDGRRLIPEEGPSRRGYTFVGWHLADGATLADFTSVTSDMNVYAKYLPKCTINFYNEDKVSLLATQTVDYATEAKIAPPTKEGYTFIEWIDADGNAVDLTAVTQSMDVYAKFLPKSTVNFYNEDGTQLIQTITVDYADPIEIEDPIKDGFVFIGWVNMYGNRVDLSSVKGSMDVWAKFGIPAIYTEDFENVSIGADGKSLETSSDKPFNKITVPSETVSGYTGAVNDGAVETTFNTVLDPGDYTSIVGGGGNASKDTKTDFTTASKALYMKDGYYGTGIYSFSIDPVTNGTIRVSYDVLTVENRRGHSQTSTGGLMSLYDSANKKLAVAISDANYTAEVSGGNCWMARDGETHVKLTGNTNGLWKSMEYYVDVDKKEYTVTFDGVKYGPFAFAQDVTQIDKIICGSPQHRGIHVIDNLSVDVRALPEAEKHTVKFVSDDGTTVIKEMEVANGKAATAPTNPTKASTAEFEYTFKEWDTDFSCVTADLTVKAVFEAKKRSYDVIFYDDDKTTELKKETLEYGSAITAPTETPTKPGDDKVTYTFKGWVDASGNPVTLGTVTGTTKIYASYEAKYATKTITVIWGDINSDKSVNGTDAMLISSYVAGGEDTVGDYTIDQVFANGLKWGDINCDGSVNGTDAMLISSYVAGGEDTVGDYKLEEKYSFEIPIED